MGGGVYAYVGYEFIEISKIQVLTAVSTLHGQVKKREKTQDYFLHFTQAGHFHEEWGRENRRPPCTTKTGSLFPRFGDAFGKKKKKICTEGIFRNYLRAFKKK